MTQPILIRRAVARPRLLHLFPCAGGAGADAQWIGRAALAALAPDRAGVAA
jgi:hypothetical protein